MHEEDRRDYIQRYESRLKEFGYSPESLGWGKFGRQETRFLVLAQEILKDPQSSVLDVGCGFADLHPFLIRAGWKGTYCGIDLVPGLLEVAKNRTPGLDLRQMDISQDQLAEKSFDYVVASGIFNAKLRVGDNEKHIAHSLKSMFRVAKKQVCVDFLSTSVDYRREDLWYCDPAWLIQTGKQLTRRLALRCDYMPMELAVFLFVDDTLSDDRKVFRAIEGRK